MAHRTPHQQTLTAARAISWEVAHAWHRIARRPGFAVAVIATLAIGIGADLTMLGLVDSLLFRPPAHVRDVDRVVDIRVRTYPDFVALRNQARSFSGVAGWFAPPRPYVIFDGARTMTAQQMLASASLFPLLGVTPAIGRFYDAQEDRPGGPHVAVLGYAFWRREFGGSRDVLGHAVRVAGDLYTIIGVAPPDFTGVGLAQIDLFLPITTTKPTTPEVLTNRAYSWLHVVARLAPGASMSRAQAETKLIYRRDNPDTVNDLSTRLLGGRPAEVHPVMDLRRELVAADVPVALWLAAVATAVLLIACANVAGLLLARAARSRREVALRAALGASRGRLITAAFVESGVLAIAGGALAIGASHWADSIVRGFILTDVAPIHSFDGRTAVLALAVSTFTALACGLWPAVAATRGDLARDIVSGGRTVAAPHARARRALLAAQLALATVLVVGAVLFVASFRNARGVDLGMSLDHVLVSDLDVAGAGYTPERGHSLIDPLIERLRAIPGVRSVALSDAGMEPGWMTYVYSVPGRDSLPRVRSAPASRSFSAVTPDFFATLGTPIVRGRAFASSDRNRRVIIVSAGFARLYWPGENPLGRCVRVGDASNAFGNASVSAANPCNEVIGVSHDRHIAPGDTVPLLEAFVPLASPAEPAQIATLLPLGSVAVRVTGDLSHVAPAVQRALHEMLPGVPSIRVQPALSMFDRSVRAWRLGASMFTAFGVIALVLAALGVYAVIGYLVTQRGHEIAIRMALGATAADVRRLVFSETLRVTAAGVGVGLVASLIVARGIHTLLFGISPLAPAVYAGVALGLVAMALAATWLPVRRAVAVDPTIPLRAD